MTTTNDLNINQDGIPIFSTATGAFASTVPPEDQALVGGANGQILGVDPTGFDVGNPLCTTGVGTPPNYSATPTVDQITINNLPAQPNDGANKQYVDTVASNFSFLDSTLCATTAHLTVSYNNGASGVGATLTNTGTLGAFSVDNYSPLVTQRVLVKNQMNQTENGVYTLSVVGDNLTPWVLTRATDYDSPSEITAGSLVSVLYGQTQADTIWAETQQITNIGTDDIIFIKFSSNPSGALLAVNNLNDVDNAATSRANLGLTNVATQNVTQYSVLVGDANDGIVSLPTGANGQVLTSGGANVNPSWQTIQGTGFSSINVQIFDTPGTYTYTPTANMQYCIVEVQGAGGGGGALINNNVLNNYNFSGGGGSGAYCKSYYDAATIGVSQSLTVGAGGAGNVNSVTGNAGSNSVFGSSITPQMIASGGTAGTTGFDTSSTATATGGNIINANGNFENTTGRINITNQGSYNWTLYIESSGGVGASSRFASPNSSYFTSYESGSHGYVLPTPAKAPVGVGGTASYKNPGLGSPLPDPGPVTGGSGGDGIIIITEYIGG